MSSRARTINPKEWLTRVFSAQAAAEGAIVRRKSSDIDTIIGRDRFLAELDRRGFQAIENAGQVVIFCNREPIETLRAIRGPRNVDVAQIHPHEFANSS